MSAASAPATAGDELRIAKLRWLTEIVDIDGIGLVLAHRGGVRPVYVGSDQLDRAVRSSTQAGDVTPVVTQWYRRQVRGGVAARFERESDILDRESYESTVVYQQWLAPGGLDHQVRVFIRHGDRVLGNLGVARAAGRAQFDDRELAILNEALPGCVRSFVDADAIDVAGQPTDEGVILFDTCGEPTFADALGLAWLARPGLRAFLVLTAHALAAQRAQPPVPHGMDIHVVPLHGERAHHLALVTPAAPIWLSPLSMLTPTQREVARLVGRGLSPTRVAAELSICVETVRTHLKHIHQRLGISRRAELVRFVREAHTTV